MPTLIANLSTGKGTWIEVTNIIKSKKWDKVFLITNKFGKEKFKLQDNICFVIIDSNQSIQDIKESIKKQIKINDFEIAINLASGNGKEHMALLEAIMELGLNFRIVTIEKEKLLILGLTA